MYIHFVSLHSNQSTKKSTMKALTAKQKTMRRTYKPVHLRESIEDERWRLKQEAKKLKEENDKKTIGKK